MTNEMKEECIKELAKMNDEKIIKVKSFIEDMKVLSTEELCEKYNLDISSIDIDK